MSLNVIVAFGQHGAFLGANEDRFHVAAGQRSRAEILADVGEDLLVEGNLFNLGHRFEQLHNVVRPLRWEQRKTEAKPSLPLHIYRQQIWPRSHRDPKLASAQTGITDMRREGREHPTGHAAVAVGLARAKDGICFVHYDNHWPQSPDRHQDSHLLALGVAYPLGPELAHFHYRQAAFAGEAIDEKRFSDAHAARYKHAAFEHVRFCVFD